MKEYREEDYLLISGIQHFIFCRRQWGLIHIEQQWEENFHTVDGEIMHQRAHDRFSNEKRKEVIISRGMPVFSHTLGITGVCDIVEFHRAKDGVYIREFDDRFQIFPIEYKRGKPKENDSDILQMVTQAMCIEEMLNCVIRKGAIFYGETKRRTEIIITDAYREKVRSMLEEMHQYYERGYTPKVKRTKACALCSLKNICLPELEKTKSAKEYVACYLREKSE